MLFGRSQLLLAGIPTGAALIGLLWLKRRRSNQCHHHTDPGGSPSPEEEDKNNIIEEIQNEEVRKKYIEIEENKASIEETVSKNIEGANFNEPELLANIITQKCFEGDRDNCEEIEILTENCCEIEKGNQSNPQELDLDSISETGQDTSEESKLLSNSSEYLFDIEIDSLKSEEELKTQEEVNTSKENIEKAKEVNLIEETSSHLENDKVPTSEIIGSEQSLEKIGDSLEVEEQLQEKKVEVVLTSSPEESLTEKVETETKEEKKTSLEEGAVAATADNMKTGSPTHLAEKLTSLELDTMKIRDETGETEQKGCTERDSANHSPSEVMLASPSISNFSDAHSEGSSDSGKGHSDVATSPSRTPAGGSSLAGDSAPSIYEFVLPQVIVGRLIGRRGIFLHEIRTSTQTNIYIKRHPDTDKLKICAIEGTQQDIDKALAKIRQKFPLRRFPQLTLEKVSFVTLNALPPLKLEDFHLQLVECVNNDVILSSLITAAHFFLQQPSHPSYGSLGTLNQVMNQIYSTSEAPPLETPIKDAVCAAATMGGWYRAQIVNLDEEAGNSTVRFLDYGGYLTLPSSSLRQIRGDLLALPFQAVECYLANVAPANEEGWSEEARCFVHNATVGQILQAQIYDYAEDGTPLVYLYASFASQVILINEELVMRGYGVLTSSIQDE